MSAVGPVKPGFHKYGDRGLRPRCAVSGPHICSMLAVGTLDDVPTCPSGIAARKPSPTNPCQVHLYGMQRPYGGRVADVCTRCGHERQAAG